MNTPIPTAIVILPPLHPKQLEVACHSARFHVLAAGRRFGKTILGVTLCLRTALEGGRTWWVSRSYKTAEEGWREVKRLARQLPDVDVREGDKILTVPGGGTVEVRSAEEPGSLRGAGLDGLVLDEAAYTREDAWSHELRPSLSDRHGWALFISTPNGKNWFHTLWQRARQLKGWKAWQFPSWTNPYLDREELEQARAELGESIFSQEYGAEFLDLALVRPFRADWLVEWERCPPASELYVAIGVDPAISKRDEASQTALVVAGRPLRGIDRTVTYVLQAEAGHWTPYETADRLLRMVQTWRARLICIEDVAWQRALKDIVEREAQLHRQSLPTIELLKPELDKLRRALRVSPLVESGRVLLGPGQHALRRALLAVPEDAGAWDLVDAFGLAVTSLPAAPPEQSVLIPAGWASIRQREYRRACGYAMKPFRSIDEPLTTHTGPNRLWRKPDPKRLARSYAVRPGWGLR